MKNRIITIFITFVIIPSLKAQKNVLKGNIFSPIVKSASFFYERSLNEKSSIQIGYFYNWDKPDFNLFGGFGIEWSGFGITPEYRYYPSRKALNGFYLAPFLRYIQYTSEHSFEIGFHNQTTFNWVSNIENQSAIETNIGGGFLVGHQWILNFFSIDTFIGPCLIKRSTQVSGKSTEYTGYDEEDFTSFGLRFGFTIGAAF